MIFWSAILVFLCLRQLLFPTPPPDLSGIPSPRPRKSSFASHYYKAVTQPKDHCLHQTCPLESSIMPCHCSHYLISRSQADLLNPIRITLIKSSHLPLDLLTCPMHLTWHIRFVSSKICNIINIILLLKYDIFYNSTLHF